MDRINKTSSADDFFKHLDKEDGPKILNCKTMDDWHEALEFSHMLNLTLSIEINSPIHAIFNRCNHIGRIRIGRLTRFGCIVELGAVPIKGKIFSDEEIVEARSLADRMNNEQI